MQVGDHNGITLCWASEERDRVRDCGCGIAYDHRYFLGVLAVGSLVVVYHENNVHDDDDVLLTLVVSAMVIVPFVA